MSKGLDIWAKKTSEHDPKIAADKRQGARLTATHDGGPSLRATAWKATRVANEKNTPEAHDAAAKAHFDFAKAAEEKGKATGNTRGFRRMALEHRDTAGYHQSKASELRGGGGDDQPRDDHGRFASK